jgi:hypothetical protein
VVVAKTYAYDVALSFAGEDREYVEKVASILRDKHIRVFYDRYEQATLWGKNLYDHLKDVYETKSRFTVMFISEYYVQKMWTSLERQSAQSRAFREFQDYILPARFDDTEVPGLLSTVGYIDLRGTSPNDLANLIEAKVKGDNSAVHDALIRPKTKTWARKRIRGIAFVSVVVGVFVAMFTISRLDNTGQERKLPDYLYGNWKGEAHSLLNFPIKLNLTVRRDEYTFEDESALARCVYRLEFLHEKNNSFTFLASLTESKKGLCDPSAQIVLSKADELRLNYSYQFASGLPATRGELRKRVD